MKKFKEAACELIGMAMPAPGTDGAEKAERAECTSGPSPPAEGAEAVTSPEDLRIKVQQQEAWRERVGVSVMLSRVELCKNRRQAVRAQHCNMQSGCGFVVVSRGGAARAALAALLRHRRLPGAGEGGGGAREGRAAPAAGLGPGEGAERGARRLGRGAA